MGMKTTLVKSALARSLARAAEAVRQVFQDTIEDAVRSLGRWAKKTAIAYGMGAALALLALLALGKGLAELLIAAGLPSTAGHLILAAVTGIIAVVLFKTGARRRVSREERWSIRVVAPRPSRRRVYDVHRASRGWEVTGPRARRKAYRTRARAVRAARRAARSGSGHLVIHGANGRIRSS